MKLQARMLPVRVIHGYELSMWSLFGTFSTFELNAPVACGVPTFLDIPSSEITRQILKGVQSG